jgi:Uma2 family endonuclease
MPGRAQTAARLENASDLISPDALWRFTVDQYHSMIRSGILDEDDPVELLHGWLMAKMPKNPQHRLATQLVRDALAWVVPAGWHVMSQEPLTTPHSEPEPDAAVVRGQPRDYAKRHPGAADVALVVEVADSSLERDRSTKKQVYAEGKIPSYWIVNLIDRRVEAYTRPSGRGRNATYRGLRVFRPGQRLPLRLDGRIVTTLDPASLLP